VPRLVTHGWALALALLVLGLAPIELAHHSVADVSATVDGLTVPMRTTIDAPTLAAPSMATASPTQLGPITAYDAKRGDTAVTVAARAGISVDALVQINQLPSTSLTPGQRLLVPPVDGTMVPVDPNQSLSLLAETFRVDPDVLRKVNGLRPDSTLPSRLFIPAVSTDVITPAPSPSPGDPATGRERVV
jgi:peptidoglycan DL-endopeptidase LytE